MLCNVVGRCMLVKKVTINIANVSCKSNLCQGRKFVLNETGVGTVLDQQLRHKEIFLTSNDMFQCASDKHQMQQRAHQTVRMR
jgi:UDP-N-acetylglucosamine transferase subunit ALG13